MINNTVGELVTVIGATAVADTGPAGTEQLARPVTDLTADSRQAGPGSLFVALPGERVDGHDFVAQAAADGAVAAITDRPITGALCLVVDDPLQALGDIGRHVTLQAKQQGLRVIGITGSAGKTSTKDLLAQILEHFAPVVAPRESMNNEIGLPLTASRCTAQDRFLISEMGAKGLGHIRYLCDVTPPDVGVELNVGVAHLGRFGDQDTIARAKSELVEALPTDGTAVLNACDHRVQAMAGRTAARVIDFAVQQTPESTTFEGNVSAAPPSVLARRLESDDLDRWGFELVIDGAGYDVTLGLLGRHQVANAAAAAAAAHAVGVPAATIATALNQAGNRSHWRMELHRLESGATLINDAYNANPTSMRAALGTLQKLGEKRRTGHDGRSIAVFGEMLELGPASQQMHEEIGAAVVGHQVDQLIGVGAGTDAIIAGARNAGMPADRIRTAPDPGTVTAMLADLGPGDIVLIKASRDIGLETVADQLVGDVSSSPAASS